MRSVGYLFSEREGLVGEPGLFYDYIIAGNGLFVRGRGPLLEATVCIAAAGVRGLSPAEEKIALPMGAIPRQLYDLAISALYVNSEQERYLAITWEGEYRLRLPPQEGSVGSVKYERLPGSVVDIHSHGTMEAFFSWKDDHDEQGLRLYMVAGKLHTLWPEVLLRVGVYGYFAAVDIDKVFK